MQHEGADGKADADADCGAQGGKTSPLDDLINGLDMRAYQLTEAAVNAQISHGEDRGCQPGPQGVTYVVRQIFSIYKGTSNGSFRCRAKAQQPRGCISV